MAGGMAKTSRSKSSPQRSSWCCTGLGPVPSWRRSGAEGKQGSLDRHQRPVFTDARGKTSLPADNGPDGRPVSRRHELLHLREEPEPHAARDQRLVQRSEDGLHHSAAHLPEDGALVVEPELVREEHAPSGRNRRAGMGRRPCWRTRDRTGRARAPTGASTAARQAGQASHGTRGGRSRRRRRGLRGGHRRPSLAAHNGRGRPGRRRRALRSVRTAGVRRASRGAKAASITAAPLGPASRRVSRLPRSSSCWSRPAASMPGHGRRRSPAARWGVRGGGHRDRGTRVAPKSSEP